MGSPVNPGFPERWLAVCLPAFRLERCGYDAVEVVALIAESKSAMRLCALTPGAREVGLREGMTVSEARSLVPAVRFEVHDPAEEARDRGELLRMFEALSDRVEALGGSTLILEVGRTSAALGGESGVLERAQELAEGLGHRASLVIADDPLAAGALAARSPCCRAIPQGGLASALAGLSPRDLGASDALDDALQAIGIRTLGAFAELDAASVNGRFGSEGSRLHRLARGEPSRSEAHIGWIGDDLPRVEAAMAGATSALQVHFVLPGLLAALSDALAGRDLAVARLRVSLRLERGNPVSFGVRVGRPTRDARTLERLIRARLPAFEGKLGAPIDALVLEAADVVPETGWQPGLTDRAEGGEPLPDVLARLIDALGASAVFAAEPVDVWRPEGAWRPVPFPLAPPSRRPPPPPDDVVLLQERWESGLRGARPVQLLGRPVPVQVREDGVGPVSVLLDGVWTPVDARRGPEVLSSDWWRPERAWDRSYWVVRMGVLTAWIYRSEGAWALHGWF